MPLDWGGNASPDDRGNPFNQDILGGVNFDDAILQMYLNALRSANTRDDFTAWNQGTGTFGLTRSWTSPVTGGGGASGGASGGAVPGGGGGGAASGANPGYSLGPSSQLGGVPNFYGTGAGTVGASTAPTGYTLGGLGSTAAPGTATGMGLGANASLLGGTGNFAAGTGANAVTWGDRARQAWDAYQQYGGALGGLAGGGGGGGGFGGAGGGGPLVTPPPPPDFSQSAPYQRGLANLLGVLGVQGSPITWPQFQGATR